jgi:hypothetical protein
VDWSAVAGVCAAISDLGGKCCCEPGAGRGYAMLVIMVVVKRVRDVTTGVPWPGQTPIVSGGVTEIETKAQRVSSTSNASTISELGDLMTVMTRLTMHP